jgi:hypothetical protein
MSVQMIELEEVQMVETSDDALEGAATEVRATSIPLTTYSASCW